MACMAPVHMVAPMLRIPSEICISKLPGFFGAAQAVGRLATCARELAEGLKDPSGRLLVHSIITGQLSSATEGLERASLSELEVFRLDLTNFTGQLTKQEIERCIRLLGTSLSKAEKLQQLAVRLASFDTSMERIRLGVGTWEALIRCLGELSSYGRLRSLDLSCFNIKRSRAIQDVSMSACPPGTDLQELVATAAEPASEKASPSELAANAAIARMRSASDGVRKEDETLVPSTTANGTRKLRRASSSPTEGAGAAAAAAASSPKLSFLDALARLSSLEVLTLTYDEIFGDVAKMLPPVFQKMEKLKRVDLTRNNIPKQDMQALRADMPRQVELCGDDLQTFYFY